MDLTDPEQYAQEQQREERRLTLARGFHSREQAFKEYNAEVARKEKAIKAEEARRKVAAKRLADLEKAVSAKHGGVEFAMECEDALYTEFVGAELLSARDKARSALSKAERLLKRAKADLNAQLAIVERKDKKKVNGVLRDARGNARRQAPSPSDPSALPPRLYGDIPNPNKWTSREQRAQFMIGVEELELAVSEREIAVEKANTVYVKAETAVSESFDEVSRAE